MNPKLLMVVVASMLFTGLRAQIKPFSIGPYAEKAWMTGSAQDRLNDGWGLGLTADIKLPGKLGVTGSFGYFQARGIQAQEGRLPSVKAYPLRAGLKYRPIPFLYFKMELGGAALNGESDKAFIVSPGIGARVLAFDIQGKYEVWSGPRKVQFWGIRAAVNF